MKEIERSGGTTNAVLVQLPERANPGVVIQRNSMANLHSFVREARQRAQEKYWEQATDLLVELDDILTGYVGVFPT